MAWVIRERAGQFCIFVTETDDIRDCFETREEAEGILRSLEEVVTVEVESVPAVVESMPPSVAPSEVPMTVPEDHVELAVQLLEEALDIAADDTSDMTAWANVNAALAHLNKEFEDTDIPVPTDGETPWEGVILLEGISTGDGRIFAEDAIVWDTLPIPFKWQRMSAEQHLSSVVIGRVDEIWRDGPLVKGRGVILHINSEAYEYAELLEHGAVGGVSIDGDDASYEILTDADGATSNLVFTSMRLRALTAVDIPAFEEARIRKVAAFKKKRRRKMWQYDVAAEAFDVIPEVPEMETITAAATGSTELILMDRDQPYDGLAAQDRIWAWAGSSDGFDVSKLKQVFLWQNGDTDPQLKGSYKLPIADIVNGEPRAIPRAIFAAAGSLEGARGGVKGPTDAERMTIRRKLEVYYRKINDLNQGPEISVPWNPSDDAKGDSLVASILVKPPKVFFDNPGLKEPTPWTITADGRLFGHLALRDTCHIGFKECVSPPMGSKYNYFHLGELETAEGEMLSVGHITFNTGHADLTASARAAANYYDDTGAVGADVRVGEDEFGIWAAGALRSTLSEADIRTLRAAPPSGDWRRIGGRLEMVAVLAVNTPGFPVPRGLTAGGFPQTFISGLPDEVLTAEQVKVRLVQKRLMANRFRIQELTKKIKGE